MPIEMSSTIVRREGVIDAESDGEIVAMNVELGICFGLNGVGSRIWKMIAAPVRVSEVCANLLEQYNVDAATCERQVIELLEGLKAEQLVVECDPA